MNRKYIIGVIGAVGGGICWGLSGSMGQYLFTREGMDSRWLVPLRLSLAGILLIAYCAMRYGKLTIEPWKSRKDRRELLVYGLLGVSLCQFLYFLTIQLSSAAIGTILQDLAPLMILAVMCISGKTLPKFSEVLSVILAIAGVALIVTHGNITELSVSAYALVAGIASAVCVMIYNVVPVNLLKKYPSPILQSWAFLLGGSVTLCLFHPWTWNYHVTPIGYFGIAFVVIVGNVFAFNLYATGIKYVGPKSAVLYGFSEPITAAIISNILGTPFTFWDGCGFMLIFIMLWLISSGKEE